MRVPLPWLQLTHEKIRFIVALAGITFADVLMFMQLGFQEALFDSSVRLHKSLEADIVLLGSKTDTFVATKPFSRRRLYEVAGLEEVESVAPVYLNFAFWKNPVKRNTRGILVVGINPAEPIINLPGVSENLSLVQFPDVVLFDRKSRLEFGPIVEEFEAGNLVVTEVANRQIKVGGLFSMGTSFGADGNIITSDVNFKRIFPSRNMGLIDMGLIKLKPGADVELTLEAIRNNLDYADVRAFSKAEFLAHEKNYWSSRTAIGFIFSLGTIMGFIVGIVIVYQILYTDVADHLPEYATLKAMGYKDIYLLSLVFQEAIILACVGFLPGFALSGFLYYNAARATGLPIVMTQARAIMVLMLTVLMCSVSGAIAVGKLRSADPADIV